MSRIGNQELVIPSGVEVKFDNGIVTVKGTKGTLTQVVADCLDVNINENKIKIDRKNEEKFSKSIHGTTTSLIKNMITGVSEGFKKS